MKHLFTVLAAILFTQVVIAQTPKKRIQIVLLGTFHFNQSLDSNSQLHSNLFTPKRQAEVTDIIDRLVGFKPTKILVEQEPDRQPFWDSIYADFKMGKEPATNRLKANEITQLGLKTAKALQLKNVLCVDFQPENFGEKNYQPKNTSDSLMQAMWQYVNNYPDSIQNHTDLFNLRYPNKRLKQDSLLQKLSLAQYLLTLNTPEYFAYSDYSNFTWFYSIGKTNEYVGVDWLTDFWYGRNLRIYTNVLRHINPKEDNKLLLIYGSSHIAFLKHLFEMNPLFEVVELDKVIGNK
jgi:hypothetical protein